MASGIVAHARARRQGDGPNPADGTNGHIEEAARRSIGHPSY